MISSLYGCSYILSILSLWHKVTFVSIFHSLLLFLSISLTHRLFIVTFYDFFRCLSNSLPYIKLLLYICYPIFTLSLFYLPYSFSISLSLINTHTLYSYIQSFFLSLKQTSLYLPSYNFFHFLSLGLVQSLFLYSTISFSLLLTLCDISVTRFGEILSIWQYSASIWAISKSLN